MTSRMEKPTDREIGRRLRVGRKSAGLTRSEAAEAVQIARTALVAIEQGQRSVRAKELQELAFHYGMSANEVLRQGAVHVDLIPQFRSLPSERDRKIEEAARMLTDLVNAEVELENTLGIERFRNYPREKFILPGDVSAQAEQDAQDLRNWLGVGAGPVKDIVSLVELDLGIRVFQRALDSSISGLFAYDNDVGACMLLNASHRHSRRTQTAAHELGHFISTRSKPNVLRDGSSLRSREEQYAHCFGRSFLTPARAVSQRFEELTAGHSHLTRHHIILLAHCFGVSREAIVRRLEELRIARSGTWDWFEANGGITDKQEKQVLGSSPGSDREETEKLPMVPPRLALLAREASKRNLFSEGQLARMLKLHRIEVRVLLEGIETEEREATAIVRLSY